MKRRAIEILGWYGVAAILLAYCLVSFKVVDVDSFVFQLLNLTGAAGIIANTYSKKDYQPLVLNIFWALIALFSLLQIIL